MVLDVAASDAISPAQREIADWQRFVDSGRADPEARNQLIQPHFEWVSNIAAGIDCEVRSPIFDSGDIASSGVIGLMNAAQTYVPGLDGPFRDYARPMVRDAMIAGIEEHVQLAPDTKNYITLLASGAVQLDQITSSSVEGARARDGFHLEALEGMRTMVCGIIAHSIFDPTNPARPDQSARFLDLLHREDTASTLGADEVFDTLIRNLPPEHRTAVRMYYTSDTITMKEIGTLLVRCESAISRTLSVAREELFDILSNPAAARRIGVTVPAVVRLDPAQAPEQSGTETFAGEFKA